MPEGARGGEGDRISQRDRGDESAGPQGPKAVRVTDLRAQAGVVALPVRPDRGLAGLSLSEWRRPTDAIARTDDSPGDLSVVTIASAHRRDSGSGAEEKEVDRT